VIHTMGFIPIKSSSSVFLAHISSISGNAAGTHLKIQKVGPIFRKPRIERNRKNNCIKKIGKIWEKTLLQRVTVTPFTLESLLYSQILQWSLINDTL
jgi:hypothetical protein